jgi:hypothetical protein
MQTTSGSWLSVRLSLLPMAFGVLGVFIDERWRQGYTLWVGACRSAGFSASVLTFTWQLLPTAIAGVLLGGVLVQLVGVWRRHQPGGAQASLAAHAGCAAGMSIGIVPCVLLPPVLVLGVEALLAAGIAAFLFNRMQRNASAMLLTRPTPSA